MMYQYRATVVKVIDGDTIDVDIDLGFDIHAKKRLRLAGINAPETSTVEGLNAKAFVVSILPVGKTIDIVTRKGPDLYNRWIATVSWQDTDSEIVTLNKMLIDMGFAVASKY